MDIIVVLTIGLAAGIVLATPPGVINLTIFDLLAKNKPRQALWVGAGSATLDVFYAMLALFSTSAVCGAISGFTAGHPSIMLCAEVAFIAALIAYGLSKLISRTKLPPSTRRVVLPAAFRRLHPYSLGCLLALTHLAVPTFLPSYTYLAALLINSGLIGLSHSDFILFALAFGAGNLVFVAAVVSIYQMYRHILSAGHFSLINRALGGLFCSVGILMAMKLFCY